MTKSFLTFKSGIALACFCLCFSAQLSNAQVVITPERSFHFGTFIMTNLANISEVTIQSDGSATSNANTTILLAPSRGEFTIDAGLANANSIYTVTTPASVNLSGPGGTMTIDNFVVSPALLITNGVGVDEFNLSARLRTQGGGISYGNGEYSSTFNITIAF